MSASRIRESASAACPGGRLGDPDGRRHDDALAASSTEGLGRRCVSRRSATARRDLGVAPRATTTNSSPPRRNSRSSDRILPRRRRASSADELVTHRVAPGVVDQLEAVGVQAGDGHALGRPLGTDSRCSRRAAQERGTVRQAGQRVVQRLVERVPPPRPQRVDRVHHAAVDARSGSATEVDPHERVDPARDRGRPIAGAGRDQQGEQQDGSATPRRGLRGRSPATARSRRWGGSPQRPISA